MFLRFFILLLSLGFITACGMSGSEEGMDTDTQMEMEPQDKTTTEQVEVAKKTVECKCNLSDKPQTVTGKGDTREEAMSAAKKDCPNTEVKSNLENCITYYNKQ